jgi:hypothetical protein
MTSVSVGQAMPFEATLTNAVPPGEIVTRGSFGPWQGPEPGETPLAGTFTFDRADLSVFKGISGILSSRGTFGGTAGAHQGPQETETPLFEVKAGGHPVHYARYPRSSTVNGNTIWNGSTRRSTDTIVAKVTSSADRARLNVALITIDKGVWKTC